MYGALTEYLSLLRTLYIPEARQKRKSDVDAHIEKLIAQIQLAKEPNMQEKLKRGLKKAVCRQRILEEHRVVNSKNPKTFYRHVNKRLNSTDHLSVLVPDDDGAKITDDAEKAELLRNHFALTYPTEEQVWERNLNPGPRLSPDLNLHVVDEVNTSPETLLCHLRRLKNSWATSPDSFPTAFRKLCGHEICVPLSWIFERSMSDGKLPLIFKEAIVIPVHKKGDRSKVSNKRNVSLTCATCKIFESVLSETILNNAGRQGLFCNEQYA